MFFDLSHSRFIPSLSGCYAITSFSEDILYVGRTNNLKRRFIEHRESHKRSFQTPHGVPYWFWFKNTQQTNETFGLEKAWLNLCILSDGLLPILNKQHG